ncbi:MAG TPA: cytidylate kinase-like family protein [Candidatus Dormibacteraeota bacterium]|nr:cytidylate kinase-like family protein [Candidatus Dormibacteraeota bacterium]
MGTVTIAATYGAGGSVIAPAVAKRLELPFIDRAIPVAVAQKIHEPLEAALGDDVDHTSRVARVLDRVLATSGLFVGVTASPEQRGALPEVARTEQTLRRIADTTGAVILGRAGVFALKGRPDVLHVRLDGDVDARCRTAARRSGIDLTAAARQQQQTDRARLAYVEHFYPRAGAWNDPRHYHVVLDSTILSQEVCIDIIVRAAEDRFSRAADTQESRSR